MIYDRPIPSAAPSAQDPAPLLALLIDREAERALDQLSALAAEVLDARLALLALAHQGELTLASCAGPLAPSAAWAEGTRLLPQARRVLERGAPAWPDRADGAVDEGGAFLGVPVEGERGRVLGVLAVTADAGRSWTDAEAQRLRGMAAAVATELDRRAEAAARRRAEAALQRSETLFRRMVENANDIIYRADRAGFFTYANPAAVRLTGYAESELLGMHFREVVRPDHRDRLDALYARQIAEQISSSYLELPIQSRDGRELWIGQNVQLLCEGSAVLGIQAVARDITEQRQVERALRESEKRFRNVVESLGQGLVITDEADVIQYANPRMAELTGYAPEEMLGQIAYALLFPPEEHARLREELQIRLLGGSSTYEVPLPRKDGSLLWLEIHAVPYRDADGEVVGSLALVEDISERRRAEEALRESEERYRLMVEGGEQVFFYVHDPENRFEYLSPSVTAVLGYWPDELIGQPYDVLLTGDQSDAEVHELTRQGLERGESFSTYTVITRHKDGRAVPVELVETPVVREGRVIGMQGFARDITERHQARQALERSEEYFRSLTENALDVIHVMNPDRTTRYVSPSVTRLLGYRPEELVGRDAEQLIHPDDRVAMVEELRAIRTTGESRSRVFRVRHRDGTWRIFEAVLRNLLDDPVVAGVVINSRDITERRRAEEESQRLAALSRKNPNPVLECDAEGRPVHVNPAAEAISRQLGLDGVTGLLPENHDYLIRASQENGQGFQSVEAAVGDRIFSWTYRPVPETRAVYLFAVDITGRRLMEEQLRHDALHDALTGLPNRLLFMERLAHAILHSRRRPPYQFAVLFLDLDRFKVVNDSLGHHVGDDLLVAVAARLQECLRPADTVARLGGDEFAILLEDIEGVEDATRVAERIQVALTTPVNLSGMDVFTSASIGIALSSSAYERPEYLLRNADMAMYRAKAAGQARSEVFDRGMHAHALTRLQVETDLRRALDRQEFRLYYQPIVSLRTGRLHGVEALVRWAHPDRGWMAPDDFIPVAEETGVILGIGEWVLREACRQVKQWQDRIAVDAPIAVGVNLSAKQFTQADLVEKIAAVLEQTGLPADALRLEITESAVMDNAENAVALLGRLKALGVHISLDDFGTGYSSLSYLHRFPLDTLKIDRTFVGRMDEEERSAHLVHTVLTLTRSLGASAVAEGIETEAQLAALRRMDCDYGQGYLFARPLPAEEMEALLLRKPVW